MTPWQNRLQKDYERLQELAKRSPYINIFNKEGEPPFKYILYLTCKGIKGITEQEEPIFSFSHKLAFQLTEEYPRREPNFRLITPVFHPNITKSGFIIIAHNWWSPTMGLDYVIVLIVETIRFQNYSLGELFGDYGLNFTANKKAAKWTRVRKHLFPLETRQIIDEEAIPIMTKVNVLIKDLTDSEVVRAELPADAPISRLLPALVTKLKYPNHVQYEVMHKESGKLLKSNETLNSVGVKSGDTLRLLPNVTAGAGIPVRSFRDIQLVEAVINHNEELRRADNLSVIFAVFLYTEQDTNLASYIRTHLSELHHMSGHHCLFFTIEAPVPEWDLNIRNSLGELAGDYFDALWERLGTSSFAPFEKEQAYNIGRRFGVLPEQFPAIVFFSNLKNKNVLILEIDDFVDPNGHSSNEEYQKFFRMLFSATDQATDMPKSSWLSELEELLKRKRKQGKAKGIKLMESKELTQTLIEVIGTVVKAFY